MHDSGERQQFSTGAVRDTAGDKPRPDLRSPFAAERCGVWMMLGAKKYSENNWMAGMPFSRVLASLERHLMKYKQGLSDEDHLAAIVFNAEALIHYEEMIRRGVLPASLDDRPNYKPEPTNEPSTTGCPACHCHTAGVSGAEEEGPRDTSRKGQATPSLQKRTPERLDALVELVRKT